MHKQLMAGLAGLALIAAACGDDANEAGDTPTAAVTSAPQTTAAVPATTAAPATSSVPETTAAPEPTAPPTTAAPATTTAPEDAGLEEGLDEGLEIVSLSPALTEMMFAIGAEDDLIAVDDQSNYPPAALDLPHDLSSYEPNVEAIAGYEPDVVLISGDFTGLGDQLAPLGIEVWDGPAAVTLDDTYAQIAGLGELTGNEQEAAAVVARMQADIDAIVAELAEPPAEPLTYYHELTPDLYSVTSTTFIGSVYSLLGLENIADTAAAETDYPQLNAEFLIEANPDLIFLADTKCCGETAATVSARPGWDAIAAVQNGTVIELDDDTASRWGPRVVDHLLAVSEAVAAVQVES